MRSEVLELPRVFLKRIKGNIYSIVLFILEHTRLYKFFRKDPAVINVYSAKQDSRTKKKLCIFASYSPDENIPEYVFYYLNAIHKEGFDIVFVTTSPSIGNKSLNRLIILCRYVVHRRNQGYDFGSWKAGLMLKAVKLGNYEKLLLTNDSCYAPIYSLRSTLEQLNGDMNGITDSFEVRYHLMSYFIIYDKAIFHRPDFLQIWNNIRMLPRLLKGLIIRLYEVGISQYYLNQGFRLVVNSSVKSLKERFDPQMPIEQIVSVHKFWSELITVERCPVLKVDLFKRQFKEHGRDDWRKILKKTNYPIKLIIQHQYPGQEINNKNLNLKIYQIYFRPEQKRELSNNFIPYFKAEEEQAEWREYWTFKKNYRKAISTKGFTGFVSWKFENKSRVSAAKFLKAIENHPGYDVYFLNPFPLDGLLFRSVWDHGDVYHPGLSSFTAKILTKAGYNLDIRKQTNTPLQAAYSNYWVGNSKFWSLYMDFTRPLEKYIRENLTREESRYIYSIADKVSNCSHIPFIFERMFTTFLVTHPEVKAFSYVYDQEDIKRRHSRSASWLYLLLSKPQFRASYLGRYIIRLALTARKIRNILP